MSDVINKAWRDFARTKDGPTLAATLTVEAESLAKQLAAVTKERDEYRKRYDDQVKSAYDERNAYIEESHGWFVQIENMKKERDEAREALRERVLNQKDYYVSRVNDAKAHLAAAQAMDAGEFPWVAEDRANSREFAKVVNTEDQHHE